MGFAMGDQLQWFSFSFTFLVFIFMVFKLWMKSKTNESPKNVPPSPPWKLPFLGHLHHLLFGLPHHCFRDLAKKNGSLMLIQLGELSNIVVSSPEVAKEVMKTHDINFANRSIFIASRILSYDLKDIAAIPYGAYWRQLRKICTLELLSTKRVQSFRSIREEEVSNLIRSISSNEELLPINLGEMLCKLSYSIVLRAAFARTCKQHEAFTSLMRKVVKEAASGFSIADLFPSIKLLQVVSGMRTRLERLHQELDAILESIIEEHRTGNANPKNGDDGADDLVSVLLKLQDHGGLEFPLTNDNIKAVILDMLVAGIDTSATTIEWAMSELIKNPRKLEKAQAEVRQVFARIGDVNESELQELKYLKLVIKETLRLHPPAPFLIPRENVDRCEINGYEIPAKSKVIVNAWAIGRDPNYWNEAERFNPERFFDSSIDYKGTNFEFIPFCAGRRMCPGMSFGMAVVLSLAHLLYHFDWKLPNGMIPENLDMSESFGATVRKKRDLYLIPIPYSAQFVQ